jgi:hypothetical protein
MPNPWFRMYTDFLEDPKMLSLAFEDQRHFIGVLALKSAGTLDQDCSPELRDRLVAQRLWIDHSAIREVKRRLVAAGLIDEDWQPLAWSKRQCRSDRDPTGAERQARHREKLAALRNGSSNGAVTLPDKRRVEEIRQDSSSTDSEGVQGESQSVAAAPHRRAQKGGSRFSAPTLDQVADYCHERGNQIDPEKFHDYYESNGWKVGKSAMKDWKAAVRNWEKRNEEHQRAGGKREQTFEQKLEFLKRRSGEII